MNKTIALVIVGCVGLAAHVAEAKMISHEMWVPWRTDFCSYGTNTDVQKCYQALYCPEGHERVNMEHDVFIHKSQIGDNWREHFTACRADCMPHHPELH